MLFIFRKLRRSFFQPDPDQCLGIGRVLRPHDQDRVGLASQLAYRRLPVRGGVAEVATAGRREIGVSVLGVFEDAFPLMHAEGGLRQQGDPVGVVAWLANKLAISGRYIKKGEVVLTGSLTEFFFVEPHDTIDVSFSSLGNIQFSVGE